ncbi:unnamed protein product [Rhizoctonia solani]|uniref:Protein kinase domain-containing protein n=1 Tax=Rhizoctonia solani TaxID=456999 RepID=A0A8H2WW47_9AGAM|nr:unnamed protein product [Rhizoctonia solani]
MSNTPIKRVPCPYELGATFSLQISPPQGESFVAEAKVVHVYTPFTMSSVMKVALASESTSTMVPDEAILKVYDRRFADDTRDQYDVEPSTYEVEAQYAEYLRSDKVLHTVAEICEHAEQLPDDAPDPVELGEHVVALLVKHFFENEKTTYNALSSLQGKYIPTFYGNTRFLDASLPGLDSTISGILIEFIPGTNLSRVNPSSIDVNAVCSTAVNIVDRYSDLNVLNRDVRLENFIVKPNGSEVVMIDFGHCRLRREGEDDQLWGETKSCQDEEGEVGYVAGNRFGWNYVASERYDVYADTTGKRIRWFNTEKWKTEVIHP